MAEARRSRDDPCRDQGAERHRCRQLRHRRRVGLDQCLSPLRDGCAAGGGAEHPGAIARSQADVARIDRDLSGQRRAGRRCRAAAAARQGGRRTRLPHRVEFGRRRILEPAHLRGIFRSFARRQHRPFGIRGARRRAQGRRHHGPVADLHFGRRARQALPCAAARRPAFGGWGNAAEGRRPQPLRARPQALRWLRQQGLCAAGGSGRRAADHLGQRQAGRHHGVPHRRSLDDERHP